MWVAEKFQSKQDIAGSPRNSFRASLCNETAGGRALNGLGGVKAYRILSNYEYQQWIARSQTTRAKFRGREGKSPDLQLRSQSTD